jgi:tetratricopeptide (TPR) repeat protein
VKDRPDLATDPVGWEEVSLSLTESEKVKLLERLPPTETVNARLVVHTLRSGDFRRAEQISGRLRLPYVPLALCARLFLLNSSFRFSETLELFLGTPQSSLDNGSLESEGRMWSLYEAAQAAAALYNEPLAITYLENAIEIAEAIGMRQAFERMKLLLSELKALTTDADLDELERQLELSLNGVDTQLKIQSAARLLSLSLRRGDYETALRALAYIPAVLHPPLIQESLLTTVGRADEVDWDRLPRGENAGWLRALRYFTRDEPNMVTRGAVPDSAVTISPRNRAVWHVILGWAHMRYGNYERVVSEIKRIEPASVEWDLTFVKARGIIELFVHAPELARESYDVKRAWQQLLSSVDKKLKKDGYLLREFFQAPHTDYLLSLMFPDIEALQRKAKALYFISRRVLRAERHFDSSKAIRELVESPGALTPAARRVAAHKLRKIVPYGKYVISLDLLERAVSFLSEETPLLAQNFHIIE